MDDEIPLAVIADFLEQNDQPGPAAAVRTLEWMLANGMEHLGDAILAANGKLGKLGEHGMAHEVSRQWSEGSTYEFHVLGEDAKLARARYGVPSRWQESRATPLEDMLRMRDQIHANSIGPPVARIDREPGPVARPIEGTYPLGIPRRVIADWLEARGLAATGLRVETRTNEMFPPHLQVVMRRGLHVAMREVEEYDLVHVRNQWDFVRILDDLYLGLRQVETTTRPA